MVAKMKDMVVMLVCEDVQDSIEFYSTALGFSVANRMDTVGNSGWASLENGKVKLMLASPNYISEPIKSEGRYSQTMYYFYPEDVKSLHSALRRSGFEVTNLTAPFYGMIEFEMLDPSGHVLVFGQETTREPTSDS